MRRTAPPTARAQRGAIAVLVGVAIIALIGLIGIVADLGHLYVRKTELQNAADAAALAGARRLNGTATGVVNARDDAVAMAAANASDFAATPVAVTDANIEFGPTPDGPWSDVATSQAGPADKFFIKVDTAGIAQGTRGTWFMPVLNAALSSTTATGYAVAGRTVCESLPMFICAPDPGAPLYGFAPGRAYLLADQPGGPGPGNVGYMDPVTPGAPKLINGEDDMAEVMCAGKTFCMGAPGTFSSLTQPSFNPMAKALNTRFDKFSGLPPKFTPEMCRPDTNVKEYVWNSGGTGQPPRWMDPDPVRQEDCDPAVTPDRCAAMQLGVHWSGVRPEDGPVAGVSPSSDYPATGTPYSQPAGSVFHQPPSDAHRGLVEAKRRIITLGIATNCLGAGGKPQINGAGKPVSVAAFATFLMPRTAIGTGGPSERGIFAEFIETVPSPPVSVPDIKLYR